MVEQNSVRGVDAVGLAIVHGDPVGVELGGAIWAARRKRRRFVLRRVRRVAVKLGGRCLIEPDTLFELENPDRLQQAQRAERVGIGRVFRRFEAHLHVALRGKIVDFGRLRLLHEPDQIGRVRHVAVVQEESCILDMRIDVEMIDALGIERRRAPLEAVHDVTFCQQQLGQIGAVLAGRAGDQCDLVCHKIRASFLRAGLFQRR